VERIVLPHLEGAERPIVAEMLAEKLAEQSLMRADLGVSA